MTIWPRFLGSSSRFLFHNLSDQASGGCLPGRPRPVDLRLARRASCASRPGVRRAFPRATFVASGPGHRSSRASESPIDSNSLVFPRVDRPSKRAHDRHPILPSVRPGDCRLERMGLDFLRVGRDRSRPRVEDGAVNIPYLGNRCRPRSAVGGRWAVQRR